MDAYWDDDGKKIVEKATLNGGGRCNTLYPNHSDTRSVAGAPLTRDVVKCQLKPINVDEYQVRFTADQATRLKRIFPSGVCDYTIPGIGQVPLAGTFLRLRASSP